MAVGRYQWLQSSKGDPVCRSNSSGKEGPVVAIVGWRTQWSRPSDHNSSALPPSDCCHPPPSCSDPPGCKPKICPLLWPKLYNSSALAIPSCDQNNSLDKDAAMTSSAQPQILSTIVIKTNRCLNNIDCNVWLSELHHSVNWSYCQWIQFQMQKPTLLIHKLKLTILDSQLPQMWKTSPGDSKQGRPSNSLAFVSKGTFTSVCNTTATVAVAEWKWSGDLE